ncbi:uncharacterized protein slr0245-like, partial [Ylistrum balloti]|uniref:uncharacterized protein slr0245-like n=1 Tax=Ylistrum balloti TaxID=509963 RepID=UPI002905A959
MQVHFYDCDLFREHDTGYAHPECAARVTAITTGLKARQIYNRLEQQCPEPVAPDLLYQAHHPDHVERVLNAQGQCISFDSDTQTSKATVDAALHAAGAVVQATENVLNNSNTTAFCAVRPPGHHAERHRVMGFCYFNNVALASYAALNQGVKRIFIFDPDVHH